uniref:Uncharacterized protein n=1 Tax=Varanus komodoensis TaxID=61221 RepID=A0A8D2LA28_VARKO
MVFSLVAPDRWPSSFYLSVVFALLTQSSHEKPWQGMETSNGLLLIMVTKRETYPGEILNRVLLTQQTMLQKKTPWIVGSCKPTQSCCLIHINTHNKNTPNKVYLEHNSIHV